MKTTEQGVKTLRRTAKSWLAILTYQCARGKTRLSALNQRLMSICQSAFKSETLRETIGEAISTSPNEENVPTIKKRILRRLTPSKVERRIHNYSQIICIKELAKKKKPITLGRFVIIWAVLTQQSPQEFLIKVAPSVNRAYRNWHDVTGCSGLSDEEFRSYPGESAQFWSELLRILIRETLEENLINFIHGGIQALGTVDGMHNMDKRFYGLLGQATRVITEETTRKIESALKENPNAGERIKVPEFEALVIREEARLSWSNSTDESALKTLRKSLSPELDKEISGKEGVIKSSMEAIGRRGLFNNLLDALSGKLKPRFVESIIHFLKAIVHVESRWEFSDSSLIREKTESILQWMFRR